MPNYLVEAIHEPDPASCLRLLDAVLLQGAHYLTHTDWGCMAGDHRAWILLDAEDDAAVKRIIPPAFRDKARIVKLNKFTPEQIRGMHGQPR